jgi:predicted nucleic acid-binding protein
LRLKRAKRTSERTKTFITRSREAAKKAAKACKVATKTGLRGMDALVVQVAKEYKAELITFDDEMLQRAAAFM